MSHSHNDHPTIKDRLGFEASAKSLAKRILDCKAPKSFGVNGQWGCGKTSFLGLLYKELTDNDPPFVKRRQLKPQEDFLVIWFEAWRYQNEPQPVVALLHEIRNELRWHCKIGDYFQKVATLENALTVLGSIIESIQVMGVSVKLEGLREVAKSLPSMTEKLSSQTLRDMLEEAIRQLLGEKRLLIFIDDLDRCTPAMAFRLLEGLKIYLSLENAIYLIAMDQRQLQTAIAKELGVGESGHLAREYFEKICQDVHHIGLLNHRQRADYFHSLLTYEERNQDRLDFCQALRELAERHRLLPPNPRRIKAFANTLAQFESCFGIPQPGAIGIFLLMAGLYHFHHEIYELVLEHPDFFNNRLYHFATGGDVKHPVFEYLKPTQTVGADPRSPTPTTGQVAFYDPQGSDVFRLGELITALGAVPHNELLAYSLEYGHDR
jgi:hypothetical protein